MNKRPGHVIVTTEVAMCMFCGRPRTLRTEQHQLGALVRTTVTCETCHRTLSSSVGVATTDATEATRTRDAAESAAESPANVEAKAAAVKPPATSRAKTAAKPKAAGAKPKAPANQSRRKG